MAPYPKMGSRISHLMAMEVGARWYVEVDDGEDYKRFQRGVGGRPRSSPRRDERVALHNAGLYRRFQ